MERKRCTCEASRHALGDLEWCDCGNPPGSGKVGCVVPFVLIIGGSLISIGALLVHFV